MLPLLDLFYQPPFMNFTKNLLFHEGWLPLLQLNRNFSSEYEKMPYGQGCPPGRDFSKDDCRRLKKVPALKFVDVGSWKDYLPKCFLYGQDRVYYNTAGKVPPKKGNKYRHKAVCKKERLPPGDSSHT